MLGSTESLKRTCRLGAFPASHKLRPNYRAVWSAIILPIVLAFLSGCATQKDGWTYSDPSGDKIEAAFSGAVGDCRVLPDSLIALPVGPDLLALRVPQSAKQLIIAGPGALPVLERLSHSDDSYQQQLSTLCILIIKAKSVNPTGTLRDRKTGIKCMQLCVELSECPR